MFFNFSNTLIRIDYTFFYKKLVYKKQTSTKMAKILRNSSTMSEKY